MTLAYRWWWALCPPSHTLTATTYIGDIGGSGECDDANTHQPAFCFLLPFCRWWLPIALYTHTIYNHTNTCVSTWHAEHTPKLFSIDDVNFR